MAKLTLSVNALVAEKAKRLAEAKKTTISAMFSQFVCSMAAEDECPGKIGPPARKSSPIDESRAGKEYKRALTEALMAKHGIAR